MQDVSNFKTVNVSERVKNQLTCFHRSRKEGNQLVRYSHFQGSSGSGGDHISTPSTPK